MIGFMRGGHQQRLSPGPAAPAADSKGRTGGPYSSEEWAEAYFLYIRVAIRQIMNYLNSMPYLAGHGAREQSRREWVMHVAPIRGKIL